MNLRDLDWDALDRLRAGFLSGSAAKGPYWKSEKDLLAYDLTYAQRIGWKWDAVLNELKVRGWSPSSTSLLDWGCGSGIAARKILSAFPEVPFKKIRFHDHSPVAREYARNAALKRYPALDADHFTQADTPPGLLVLSHVLNELSPSAKRELITLCQTVETIIWVEPGTHAVSRELIQWRDQLRETFSVIAPCTHQSSCGLLSPENERHWCHYFAPPPANIYADSDWVKFGQRAGIDLRSLPYCFLVLEKKSSQPPKARHTEGCARLIGHPRVFKGYAKLLSCDQCGVHDLTLQKRADPKFFKALENPPSPPIFKWTKEGDKISQAENW